MFAVSTPWNWSAIVLHPMVAFAPPVSFSDRGQVLASSLAWVMVSAWVGWRATKWSPERLERTGPLTTLRAWEDNGGWWQRTLRVRRWKDRLPEAGGLMPDGRSMRTLQAPGRPGLRSFRAETIRAERVHWLIAGSVVIHVVWCRPAVFAGMAVFAVVFNAPFIVIQRFNRGRIDRLLERSRVDP